MPAYPSTPAATGSVGEEEGSDSPTISGSSSGEEESERKKGKKRKDKKAEKKKKKKDEKKKQKKDKKDATRGVKRKRKSGKVPKGRKTKAKKQKASRQRRSSSEESSGSELSPLSDFEPAAAVRAAARSDLDLLFEAARTGNMWRVEYYLEGDGCFQLEDGRAVRNERMNVNAVGLDGMSLLCLACAGGHEAVVEFLLARSSNVSWRHPQSGLTPLHRACDGQHYLCASMLVAAGADPHAAAADGSTPESLGLAKLLEIAPVRLEERQRKEKHEREAKRREKDDREFFDKLGSYSAIDSGRAAEAAQAEAYSWEADWHIPKRKGRDKSSSAPPPAAPPRQKAAAGAEQGPWRGPTEQERASRGGTGAGAGGGGGSSFAAQPDDVSSVAWASYADHARKQSPASMEALWKAFEQMADAGGEIRLESIPFPAVPPSNEKPAGISNAVLGGFLGLFQTPGALRQAEQAHAKQSLRQAYMRFHPDKFAQKFGSRLVPEEREAIMDAVTEVAQYIALLKDLVVKLSV